jgi:hypothetical protein
LSVPTFNGTVEEPFSSGHRRHEAHHGRFFIHTT